jgi:hypothetical protein
VCLIAYLGSDRELPLVGRAPEGPLHVARASDGDERQLRRHVVTRPLVYVVGARGCACDFQVEADGDSDRSLTSLADYLITATRDGPLDFYACWIGDQSKPPTARATVTTEYFRRRPFEFEDRKLLTIVAGT